MLHFFQVIVLEGSHRLGGWVHTTKHEDGSVFEHGPRSIRPVGEQGQNTLKLVGNLNTNIFLTEFLILNLILIEFLLCSIDFF